MKILNIYKAQGSGSLEPEDLTLVFDTSIPSPTTRDGWEPKWREQLMSEGKKLADALCNVLPGGVVDALLVELLDHKRSMFVVPTFSSSQEKRNPSPEKVCESIVISARWLEEVQNHYHTYRLCSQDAHDEINASLSAALDAYKVALDSAEEGYNP